jgi:hypothetical protein
MLTERLASTERFSRVGGRASYPVADLVSAMVSAGAEFRVPPVADGKVRRTATVTHPAKKNFTYVLYPDGLAGWFENHETGDGPRRIYLVGKETEIATDQREKWEAARMKRETLAEKKRIAARILAQEICGRARPADPWHAYLAKKKIRPFKLLQVEADLIAPIVSVEGEVQTLERIRPDGTKGFLPGGRVSGNFPLPFRGDGATNLGGNVCGQPGGGGAGYFESHGQAQGVGMRGRRLANQGQPGAYGGNAVG